MEFMDENDKKIFLAKGKSLLQLITYTFRLKLSSFMKF